MTTPRSLETTRWAAAPPREVPMDAPRNLVDEAVAHLAGTPWKKFKGRQFHDAVLEIANRAAEAGSQALGALERPPVPGARKQLHELVDDTLFIMQMLHKLIGSCLVNYERRKLLGHFFPFKASIPDGPAPKGFIAVICFDAARILYPRIARPVVLAYVDTRRRQAWGAWPCGTLTFASLNRTKIRETELFESLYWRLALASITTLHTLGKCGRNMRRRIAEDAVFVDKLYLAIASAPITRRLYFMEEDGHKLLAEQKHELDEDVQLPYLFLCDILVETARPWTALLQRNRDPPSAGWLAHIIITTATGKVAEFKEENGIEGDGEGSLLDTVWVQFMAFFRKQREPLPDEESDELSKAEADGIEQLIARWKRAKHIQHRANFYFPDVCDWCSREPAKGNDGEPTKLRQCSKCVFARYCGKEHQLLAWKTGVKSEWLHRLPHKCVCVDAKTEI